MRSGSISMGAGSLIAGSVPVIGGEPARLTHSGRHPRFSPDGRWTSYVSVATDSVNAAIGAAYLMPFSGGEARRVGPDLLAEDTPVWSPFPAAFGDAVNVFRAPISREAWITGLAVRVTSGTTTEISPALTASGELIFASLNQSLAVWSLSADPDHAKLASELKRITLNATAILPPISLDEWMLAFTAARRRTRGSSNQPVILTEDAADLRIEIKHRLIGKETSLDTADTAQWRPQISRDGSMVAYTSGKPGRIYAASAKDGRPKMIVDGQNLCAWDWSFDKWRARAPGALDGY